MRVFRDYFAGKDVTWYEAPDSCEGIQYKPSGMTVGEWTLAIAEVDIILDAQKESTPRSGHAQLSWIDRLSNNN